MPDLADLSDDDDDDEPDGCHETANYHLAFAHVSTSGAFSTNAITPCCISTCTTHNHNLASCLMY
jgi:hypothetical protein